MVVFNRLSFRRQRIFNKRGSLNSGFQYIYELEKAYKCSKNTNVFFVFLNFLFFQLKKNAHTQIKLCFQQPELLIFRADDNVSGRFTSTHHVVSLNKGEQQMSKHVLDFLTKVCDNSCCSGNIDPARKNIYINIICAFRLYCFEIVMDFVGVVFI